MKNDGIKNNIGDSPELYDWLYENENSDVNIYSAFSAGIDEVLECGIGTGRIAIPLAKEGKTIYGIDLSREMLNQLNKNLEKENHEVKKRIITQIADMRDFSLGRTFKNIYIPFSTFNLLLTMEEQKKCLESVCKHLDKDGILVLELLSFKLFDNWLNNDHTLLLAKSKFRDGKRMQMFKSFDFDCTTQIVTQHRYYKEFDNDGNFVKEKHVLWESRLFFIGEIKLLLENYGLEIVEVVGDNNLGPYTHESEFFALKIKRR